MIILRPTSIHFHVNVFKLSAGNSLWVLLLPSHKQSVSVEEGRDSESTEREKVKSPRELTRVQRWFLTVCSYSLWTLNRTNQFTNDSSNQVHSGTVGNANGRKLSHLLWTFMNLSFAQWFRGDLKNIEIYIYCVSRYSLKILRYFVFRPYRPALRLYSPFVWRRHIVNIDRKKIKTPVI